MAATGDGSGTTIIRTKPEHRHGMHSVPGGKGSAGEPSEESPCRLSEEQKLRYHKRYQDLTKNLQTMAALTDILSRVLLERRIPDHPRLVYLAESLRINFFGPIVEAMQGTTSLDHFCFVDYGYAVLAQAKVAEVTSMAELYEGILEHSQNLIFLQYPYLLTEEQVKAVERLLEFCSAILEIFFPSDSDYEEYEDDGGDDGGDGA